MSGERASVLLIQSIEEESAVNKSELIDHIAEKAGLSKSDAASGLDAAVEAITGALARGGEVSVAASASSA